MLNKICSSLCLLIASSLHAEGLTETKDLNLITLSSAIAVSNPSHTVKWTPEAGGLKRFELDLPKQGISDALRYRDASALFYLSHLSDNGISSATTPGGIIFFADSDTSSLTYRTPINKDLDFSLGFDLKDQIEPLAGLSYKLTSNNSRLGLLEIGLIRKDPIFQYSSVWLSENERSETFAHFTTGPQQTLSFGRRWFEFYPGIDATLSIQSENSRQSLESFMETDSKIGQLYFGAGLDEASGKLEARVGLRLFIDPAMSKGKTSNVDFYSPQDTPSLKRLRRSALSGAWSEATSFDHLQ
jgi:hypothetical protein